MNKLKLACLITFLALCLAVFGGLINQQIVLAQGEKIELNAKYPIRPGPSATIFSFQVDLLYSGGKEPLTFELSAEGPPDWLVSIQQSAYEATEISAIRLDPTMTYPETIAVVAMAPYWLYPEPGDYTITLKAAAGEIQGSVDLTARITARYNFTVETSSGLLNIKATAGKESYLKIIVTNTGTATLDKITLSSMEPRGIAGEEWSISFKPEEIKSLSPGYNQEVEVTIKPPPKTIAGDYEATLQFLSEPTIATALPELAIRVTVGTSTRWGWIGAGIVVLVIAGLYFTFSRFGRR